MRALILVLLLSGCAGVQSANPSGGIVRTGLVGSDEMLQSADAHCAKYGKRAQITGQLSAYNPSDFLFACVSQ